MNRSKSFAVYDSSVIFLSESAQEKTKHWLKLGCLCCFQVWSLCCIPHCPTFTQLPIYPICPYCLSTSQWTTLSHELSWRGVVPYMTRVNLSPWMMPHKWPVRLDGSPLSAYFQQNYLPIICQLSFGCCSRELAPPVYTRSKRLDDCQVIMSLG